jgi:hypothetical protein
MRRTDWAAWHRVYDDPTSEPSRRLRLIQTHLRRVLSDHPPGPIRVIIPCAGQGRDLLGVLVDHPRRRDVVATLVDIEPENVEVARSTARDLGLPGINAIVGDAGRTNAYVEAAPASVVVLAGFFQYLSDRDASRLIRMLPRLCAADAVVLWARRINVQKRTVPSTRDRFDAAGFREIPTDIPDEPDVHVGIEHFVGVPLPLVPDTRLFSFRDPLSLRNLTFRRVRRSIAFRLRRLVHGGH